jgi:hypothetical protein
MVRFARSDTELIGRVSARPNKTYKSFPHGMPTTEADTINADLLTFLKA